MQNEEPIKSNECSENARVGLFLSYAREDSDILHAVYRALYSLGDYVHKYMDIFYDKKSIKGGEIFRDKIRENLRTSDYFIAIYAGTYKLSHSYSGFELGYFVSLIDEDLRFNKSSSRKIVAMYVGSPPAPTDDIQGIDLTVDVEDLKTSSSDYRKKIEENIENDPLTDFFASIADDVERRLPKTITADRNACDKNRLTRYQAIRNEIVPNLRLAMHECLSRRIARHSIEQPMIEFELPKGSSEMKIEKIPLETILKQYGGSFGLFQFDHSNNEKITWREFKEGLLSKRNKLGTAVLEAIEQTFITAVSPDFLCDKDQIIRAFSDNLIYRLIVTRHFDYYDGRKTVHMYFIETLKNFFNINDKDSVLLGFLNIAAKYRSIFLEAGSPLSFEAFLLERNQKDDLKSKIRSLLRQLLILENESHFFKLDTPAAILIYGHGIDMDEVLKIQQKWFDVRKNLVDLAGKILGTDQESDEFENSINNWLGVLEQFSHVSGEINSKLALKALDNLREFFK